MLAGSGIRNYLGYGELRVSLRTHPRKRYWTKVRSVLSPSTDLQPTSTSSVYRISWLRAKSRQDRWNEELSMTSHEMVWVVLWFQRRSAVWRSRAASELPNGSPGLAAYAH